MAVVKYYRTLWNVPFSRYSGSISICFVRQLLKYSELIWQFAAREGKKVKYVFANTTAEGKKVKSFTSEHSRVSNLINHVTLRIKFKKKYSEWIWRFDANTPAAVEMNEINHKYENTRKIHRLLTNQNPGFLYRVGQKKCYPFWWYTTFLSVNTFNFFPEICHRSMKFLLDTNSLLFCHYFWTQFNN